MALAQRVMQRAFALYGQDVLAVGVYGSTARGDDGPYSDLEMMVIVREGDGHTHEWTTGPWKAEVNIRTLADALESAAYMDDDWPLAQGEFVHVLPLYDSAGVFPRLRQRVFDHSDDAFGALMYGVIVGDILELVGKWRNMQVRGAFTGLPALVVKLAQHTAWLIGIANHRLYSTSANMFAEALEMANRPAGFDALCKRVMEGDLRAPEQLIELSETLWHGIAAWAEEQRIELVTDPLELGA
jgi:kanamycin nucleotidyltransferase